MDNVDYKAVRRAALALSLKSDEERVAMLLTVADALDARRQEIEKANVLDIDQARRQGMGEALIHRLALPSSKLDGAIAGVRAVAAQKSPVGLVRQRRLLDEGLVLEQVTYPIGVIGMIFEARPDALIQIVSLAIKSANGLILKGGREAQRTNACLVDIIRSCLDGAPFIALISSHEDVDVMLRMEGEVDLIIPRGSASFVRHVMDNTHIPVLGHADGICSVYIHSQANLDEAVAIAVDSKVQYPAACNAAETILVDRAIAPRFIPAFQKALREYGVIIHADGEAMENLEKGKDVVPATEADFDYDGVTDTKWSDYMLETGHQSRHTFGVEGGNDKGRFYASLSYTDNNGIITGDKDIFKRLVGQVNGEYKIKDWLTAGVNITIDKSTRRALSESSRLSDTVMASIMTSDPITPYIYADGQIPQRVQDVIDAGNNVPRDPMGNVYGVSVFSDASYMWNPAVLLMRSDNESESFRARGTAYLNLTPFKGFVFTSRLGFMGGYTQSSTYNSEVYTTARNNQPTTTGPSESMTYRQ